MSKSKMLISTLLPILSSSGFASFKEDPLQRIDIEKEYALIKQKKCKLSANLRRMIVKRIEEKNEQKT